MLTNSTAYLPLHHLEQLVPVARDLSKELKASLRFFVKSLFFNNTFYRQKFRQFNVLTELWTFVIYIKNDRSSSWGPQWIKTKSREVVLSRLLEATVKKRPACRDEMAGSFGMRNFWDSSWRPQKGRKKEKKELEVNNDYVLE